MLDSSERREELLDGLLGVRVVDGPRDMDRDAPHRHALPLPRFPSVITRAYLSVLEPGATVQQGAGLGAAGACVCVDGVLSLVNLALQRHEPGERVTPHRGSPPCGVDIRHGAPAYAHGLCVVIFYRQNARASMLFAEAVTTNS